MTPIKNSNKPEFIGQLIDVVEDFITPRVTVFAVEDDEPIIVGEDYDALHDAFEILLKNWRVIQVDPDKSDIDFYIGQDNSSGIYAKSKEEFFSYLSELISEAEKRGEEHFDINIV